MTDPEIKPPPPCKVAVFDLETNGLLNDVHTIHSLVIRWGDNNTLASFTDAAPPEMGYDPVSMGVGSLNTVDTLVAHNGIGYDVPVLEKLGYGRPSAEIIDTLVLARLVFPDVKRADFECFDRAENDESYTFDLPKNLAGAHSLKAWGYRLRMLKGDFSDTADWSTWTREMQDYCERDTEVTLNLYNFLMRKKPDPRAVQLEHQVAEIIARQERRGVCFNVKGAEALYAEISAKRQAIIDAMISEGGWWWAADGKEATVKRTMRRTCKVTGIKVLFAEGAIYTKIKRVDFSPSSRQHVALLLQRRYGWKPKEFTNGGDVEVSEDILAALPYPPAKKLAEYYMLEKRLGMLAEGKQAWLKVVSKDGRIHGRLVTNGTPTGRGIHSSPNLSQVPSISNAKGTVPYGREFRALFMASTGLRLVGADASGLELRCLAHYLSRWDGGEYIRVVTEGDVHWTNAKAFFGLDPALELDPENADHKFYRGAAKRIIYALMYGAGPELLGDIVNPRATKRKKVQIGKQLIGAFMSAIPAFGKLKRALSAAVKEKGYLVGLDGRHIPVRSEHSALNFLLQSAGAIICKRWMVETRALLDDQGIHEGQHYWQVLWVHDEVQIEAQPEYVEAIKAACEAAVPKAGEYFGFSCPLGGEAKDGATWADTH